MRACRAVGVGGELTGAWAPTHHAVLTRVRPLEHLPATDRALGPQLAGCALLPCAAPFILERTFERESQGTVPSSLYAFPDRTEVTFNYKSGKGVMECIPGESGLIFLEALVSKA